MPLGVQGRSSKSPEEDSHWTSWRPRPILEPITEAKPVGLLIGQASHVTTSAALGLRSLFLGLRVGKG